MITADIKAQRYVGTSKKSKGYTSEEQENRSKKNTANFGLTKVMDCGSINVVKAD